MSKWCPNGTTLDIGIQKQFNNLIFITWTTASKIISQSACQTISPCTIRAPVFGRHHFFGTSEHYGKAHGSLLSGWMNYNYTACCWFPTSSNILILPSQFWQIRFESYWSHCSKCRILDVLLRYLDIAAPKSDLIFSFKICIPNK